jgi:glycosyltransferase involved in cell wall biosynthesis
MSKRVWIDVTDFLKWHGVFTGFQHIQYNIAKQYLAAGKDVAFFVYDEGAHAFREVPFDPDEVSKGGIRREADDTTTASSLHRRALSAIKRRTPARVKRLAKRVLAKPEGTGHDTAVHVVTSSPFGPNDVVVVLGGIWHGSFAADMAREKEKRSFKFVHIVHDMIPDRVPAFVVEDLPGVFRAYKKIIFSIADGLIINSDSSKRDALLFMKEHNITPPPIHRFRIADEKHASKATPRKGAPKEFMLCVGTIEVRKNPMLLYYAYKQGLREGKKLPPLLMVGRNGWLTDDFLYMITHDPETKDRILVQSDVTNEELAWLFKNCLFTIWPSFYEGWGMPVAESLSYGKVCLSSDASSMPEIAPGLLDFFSPYDSKQCLDLMVTYLDKKTREAKEQQIREKYKVTTWNNMYESISHFIDNI